MIRLGIFLILAAAGFSGNAAWAACASPQGVAGQMEYIGGSLQFSDGCNWNIANLGVTGTTCTVAGRVLNNGTTSLQWCDGAHQVTAASSTSQSSGTCSTNGKIQWDSTHKWKQWCDGTNWRAMQAPHVAATVTANFASGLSTLPTDTIAFAGGFTAGNTVICVFQMDAGAIISGVVDSKSNTYTKLLAYTSSWGAHDEAWIASNIAAGTTSISATYSGATFSNSQCAEFSGIAATNPLDQIGIDDQSGFGATPTPSVTTTSAKELLFGYMSTGGAGQVLTGYNFIQAPGSCPTTNFFTETVGTYAMQGGCDIGCTGFLLSFRSKSTTSAPSQHTCQIALSGSGSWTVPSDWNNANNSVVVIGGGGGGSTNGNTTGGGGGGGGAYAKTSTMTMTAGASVTYAVGAGGAVSGNGGDSWFNGATCLASSACGQGGRGATTTTGGAAGLAANGTGGTTTNGGYGNGNNLNKGGGGGGAGGAAAGNPTTVGGTSTPGGRGDGAAGGLGGAAGANGRVGGEYDGARGSGGGGGGGSAGADGGNGAINGGGGGGSGKGAATTPGSGGLGLVLVTWKGTICK